MATTVPLHELLKGPASAAPRPQTLRALTEVSHGKEALEIHDVEVLEIGEAKDVFLRTRPGKGGWNAGSAVEKVRAYHHALARAMAGGMKDAEIKEQYDVSSSALNTLRRSPTFQALLLTYMKEFDQAAIDTRMQVSVLGSLALDALTDRVATQGDQMKISDLKDIAMSALDRTGHGPSKTVAVTTLALTPEAIRRIREQKQRTISYAPDPRPEVGADAGIPDGGEKEIYLSAEEGGPL